jgi:hypothetical protein
VVTATSLHQVYLPVLMRGYGGTVSSRHIFLPLVLR